MASIGEVLADGRRYTLTASIPPEHFRTTLWEWFQTFRKQMVNDPMPQTREGIATWMEQRMARGGKSYLALDESGQPVGAFWSDVGDEDIYMAHFVFARGRLSREAKLAIMKRAARQFFADGARKLSWGIYSDNLSAIAFLQQVGASVEGTLRKVTRREGQLMDVVLLAAFPEDLK